MCGGRSEVLSRLSVSVQDSRDPDCTSFDTLYTGQCDTEAGSLVRKAPEASEPAVYTLGPFCAVRASQRRRYCDWHSPVPRNKVEGSICQRGVDSIKLIQVGHVCFVAMAMMVSLAHYGLRFKRSMVRWSVLPSKYFAKAFRRTVFPAATLANRVIEDWNFR